MNFEEFNKTPIIKKMTHSKSEEKLDELDAKIEKPKPVEKKNKRGRKVKYTTDKERLEARRLQQKEYRERKKQEIKNLKEKVAEYEALVNVH